MCSGSDRSACGDERHSESAKFALLNREEAAGILRDAVEAHFEMQVRTSRAAGRPNAGNALSAHDEVAFLDKEFGAMRITRDEPVSVVNLDAFAVGGMIISINHFAAGGCIDCGAGFGSEVHAFVEGLMAVKRVNPVSEVRGVIYVFNGWQRRQELALRASFNQKRFQHRELVGLDVDVFVQFTQLPGEIVNRERCADRRGSAATAIGCSARQLCGLQTGHLGEFLTQPVQPQHVRLHLTELEGKVVNVVLNLLLALFCFSVLIGQKHTAYQRMIAGGGVPDRQVISERSRQTQRQQRDERQADDLRNANIQRFLGSKITRNNDNLQVRFLNFPGAGKALYPRPKALTQFLDRLPALSSALLHAREGSRQFDVLIEVVPERLKRFVVAMSASGPTLSITVASAEAAHLTRLLSTEMLTKLDRKGLKFNEISLKTQSNSASVPRARVLPEIESQRKLNAVASRIKSERMQTSLKRLAKTLANR